MGSANKVKVTGVSGNLVYKDPSGNIIMTIDGTNRQIIIPQGSAFNVAGNDVVSYPGRIYYVNNITGKSTNNGLSWTRPFAEVSQAITAAEAFRATWAANNRNIRNTIFVQGTVTAYAAITALPSFCDIIGIGADPRGNGQGIARIDGAGAADSVASSDTVRSCNWTNFQFTGSGNYYNFNLTGAMFRSEFKNCAFQNMAYGGFYATANLGAMIFRDCYFGGDTTTPAYGMYINQTGNFNQCLIEDCVFIGSTKAVYVKSYLQDSTMWRRCRFTGGTHGFHDASTETTVAGNSMMQDCVGYGTTAGILFDNNAGIRAMRNVSNSNGTIAWYYAFT